MAKTKRIFILFAAMLFLISSVASAEVVRVEGVTGQCIMGDTDTPAKAKEGGSKGCHAVCCRACRCKRHERV